MAEICIAENGYNIDYWRGFAAALDTIEFGVRFGSHWRIALRRARLFAFSKIVFLEHGWRFPPVY